ncbi:MAG: energy transducer TonB [Gammaproteobacteria bacterium]|nr:energy transducer TonB [Gammaproteobacteria bacterium]
MSHFASNAASWPEPQSVAASNGSAASPAADLTVLAQSDDFLLELAQIAGGLAAMRPVDSAEAAFAAIASGRRPQVLAIDGSAVAQPAALLEACAQRAPSAIVVVFLPESRSAAFATAVEERPPFAVLSLPLDSAATHATLTRAIEAAAAPSATTAAAPRARAALSAGRADPPRPPPAPRVRRTLWFSTVAAAVALLLAGIAYRFLAPATPAPAAKPVAAATPPSGNADLTILGGRAFDLLEKARAAMRARHYTDPPGDNALVYYRSAAAADPASGEARDGLQRIAALVYERFHAAIAASQLNEATNALANLRAAVPTDPRIASAEAQLQTLQAAAQKAAIARRAADAEAARQAELAQQKLQKEASRIAEAAAAREARARTANAAADQSARLAQARLDAGELTSPAGDSASDYIAKIRAEDPSYPGLAPLQQRLADALVARTRAAAAATKAPSSTTPAAAPHGPLVLISNDPPVYPENALERGIGGKVVVGYTIDPTGRTRDVHVVRSKPARIFDEAARRAVEHWRYAPVRAAGKAVAVPAEILIRFDPPK